MLWDVIVLLLFFVVVVVEVFSSPKLKNGGFFV